MNILCPNCQPCELYNLPYTNLSAEEPDAVHYISNPGPIFPGPPITDPPIRGDTTWSVKRCDITYVSTISQEDADQQAAIANVECANDQPPNNFTDPPVGPIQLRTLWANTPQTAYSSCPDGSVFYYTIPMGRIVSYSQRQANALAYNMAQSAVRAHRICLYNLSGSCRADGTVSLIISAIGTYVDPGIAGSGTNLWQILGSLPTGLTMKPYPDGPQITVGALAGASVIIEGTPAAPGAYAFTLSITLSNGDYAYKTYQVEVLNSLTNGTFVSPQLPAPTCASGKIGRALSGSLPEGMTISQDINGHDQITGAPTTNGVCVFTITYS